jgi:hypothetical protein
MYLDDIWIEAASDYERNAEFAEWIQHIEHLFTAIAFANPTTKPLVTSPVGHDAPAMGCLAS